jgi:hypothetical protein
MGVLRKIKMDQSLLLLHQQNKSLSQPLTRALNTQASAIMLMLDLHVMQKLHNLIVK